MGDAEKLNKLIHRRFNTLCEITKVNEHFINTCNENGLSLPKEEILAKSTPYTRADQFYTNLRMTAGNDAPRILLKVAKLTNNKTLLQKLMEADYYPKFKLSHLLDPSDDKSSSDESSEDYPPPTTSLPGRKKKQKRVTKKVAPKNSDRSPTDENDGGGMSKTPKPEPNPLIMYGDPDATGMALIINIKSYKKPSLSRNGSVLDITALISAFQRFGILVFFPQNLDDLVSIEEIFRWIKEYKAKFVNGHHKFSFFVLMGHGSGGDVFVDSFGTETKTFDKIFRLFDNKQFQVMTGKPKIFILQCCRGGAAVPRASVFPDNYSDSNMDNHPGWVMDVKEGRQMAGVTDFLIVWATISGAPAFRNVQKGSKAIQDFSDVLQKYADRLVKIPTDTKLFTELMDGLQEGFRFWFTALNTGSGAVAVTQPIEISKIIFGSFCLKLHGESDYSFV